MRRLTALAVATALAVLALGGCGDDATETDAAATSTSADMSTSTVVGKGSEAAGEYEPVSDVAAHAAIGQDIAALKTAMDPATKGQAVDWASVGKIFEQGGASKKGDGSNRTLAVSSPSQRR